MKREDCWMTFSEALETYLTNRDKLPLYGIGRNYEYEKECMSIAAQHIDALTSLRKQNEPY